MCWLLVLWFVGVAQVGRPLWRGVALWDFASLNPLGWGACWDNENCHIEVPAFAGMTGGACFVDWCCVCWDRAHYFGVLDRRLVNRWLNVGLLRVGLSDIVFVASGFGAFAGMVILWAEDDKRLQYRKN